MNNKIVTIISGIMVVAIVILSAVGVKNVINMRNADKNLKTIEATNNSDESKISQGTLTEEMSKIYDAIADYRTKVSKIVDNTSHDNNEEIKTNIEELKKIQEDINKNHSDFKNYNAGVELNKEIQNSISALESQIFLNDIKEEK